MITCEPTQEILAEWKAIWRDYKDQLRPNRKTGAQLVDFLQQRYTLTELFDPKAAEMVTDTVMMNEVFAEKLPDGAAPIPRTFLVADQGNGESLYRDRHNDPAEVWQGVEQILVGIDLASGVFMVEGSTMLWDELCAFQGLDEMDLKNFVCVAQYYFGSEIQEKYMPF